jgi:N-acetylneuraminate lyase
MDECLLAALAVGASGAGGSTYNFAAPVYRRMWSAWERGDHGEARVEQYRSVRLVRLLDRYGYMPASKALMGFLGVDVGPARLPNRNLAPDDRDRLQEELETLGFFDWGA